MTAKEIPISKPSRIIKQQAEATIQNLIDAVVEFVTNCDDSYSRLEGIGKQSFGEIEIYVSREKGGRCKEFRIRDYAEGMNREELERAIAYGEESSGYLEGKTVRGLLGRGLKEAILGLGKGEIYTKKDRIINHVKIWWDKKERKALYEFLDDFNEKDSEVRKFIHTQGNGTFIKIQVKNEKIKIPEGHKFREQVANHYALREINSSKKREASLTFKDSGRRKLETYSRVEFISPKGDVVLDESLTMPSYGDLVRLKVWESPESLTFQRYDPCSTAGILVKTKGAILDNRLFKYDNDPAAFYFWGEASCEGLAQRLRFAIKEGKESEIIDLTRKGLNWRSDYCKTFQKVIEKCLSPLIQKKKKELETGEKRKMPRKIKKMLKSFCKELSKFAKLESKEWEGPCEPEELEIDSLTIIPSKANIETNVPRALSIYAPKDLVDTAGVSVSVMSEFPGIRILVPGTKRLVSSIGVNLDKHSKNPDVYYGFFKIRGKELGKETYIYCKLGNQEAIAHVIVKKPTKRTKRKGGFISDINTDGRVNPTQRVTYKERMGTITIFVNFPGVNKYLSAGLKEVEDNRESQVMLAELVGEAFCKAMVNKIFESGAVSLPPAGDPMGAMSAFDTQVNNMQRKYLGRIHELILNWKFT